LILPEQSPGQTNVDVWTIALDEERPTILSPEELERAARFRFELDRIHWSNARSALRTILGAYLRAAPGSLGFSYGPYGKPALDANIHFNITHSGAWAMIAVTPGAPVGIDLERIRDDVEIGSLLERIGEPAMSGTTAELFRIWARREARTKAMGRPLMEIPKGDLRVVDLNAPDGFAAALALVGHAPRVTYRDSHATTRGLFNAF
jgi:4'-phosphopantetheinyl transferase